MADFTPSPNDVVAFTPNPNDAPIDAVEDNEPKNPTFGDMMVHAGKASVGMTDFLVTGMTAGVAEIVSGGFGLANLMMTGDPDAAAERVGQVQDFLTVSPLTPWGDEIIGEIIPPLSKADTQLRDIAETKADGDPMAEAGIYSVLMGSIDFIPGVKSAWKKVPQSRSLLRQRQSIMSDAKRLGINITLKDFGDDVARVAKELGSSERGEGAQELAIALRRAERNERRKKNAAFIDALDKKTYVQTGPVRRLADDIAQQLADNAWDITDENMGVVRKILMDMQSTRLGFGAGQNLAVRLNNLEKVRRSINKRTGSDDQVNSALFVIKDNIDNFLTDEFNKMLVERGQLSPPVGGPLASSAMSGDAAGVAAWIKARKTNRQYMEWFKEDKIIANLISKDATPETMRQWLMGASAVNANKEAASTIRRMKQILGDEHPAIEAIRADFNFELVEPLLREKPNFRAFSDKFDMMVRRNPSLVKELGIMDSDIKIIAGYAEVQRYLPPEGKFYTLPDIVTNVSRYAVGSDVAKGSARVGLMTRLLNAALGIDAVSQKQIIQDILNVQFDQPIIPKKSKAASAFIIGAAISGLSDEEKSEYTPPMRLPVDFRTPWVSKDEQDN